MFACGTEAGGWCLSWLLCILIFETRSLTELKIQFLPRLAGSELLESSCVCLPRTKGWRCLAFYLGAWCKSQGFDLLSGTLLTKPSPYLSLEPLKHWLSVLQPNGECLPSTYNFLGSTPLLTEKKYHKKEKNKVIQLWYLKMIIHDLKLPIEPWRIKGIVKVSQVSFNLCIPGGFWRAHWFVHRVL